MAAASAVGDVAIVAVDAMQVYRGMDIGTAKPTPADQAAVPHHGIDLVDPCDPFTVADYRDAAGASLAAIAAAGRRALLVAGTGLYLRVLIDDLDLPGQWPAVRAALEGEPLEVLYAELCARDPRAAARIEPTNGRRIVRALEVCRGSGRPFSSFGPGLDVYADVPIHQIGLDWDRALLGRRIGERVARMMADGLRDEVHRLWTDPRGLSRTARQALGYKELIDAFEGRCEEREAVEQIVARTRQFAVRQIRWFRRDPRIRWIHLRDDPLEALPAVIEALHA